MKNALMVRSAGGQIVEAFRTGVVAIGWVEMGDLSPYDTLEKLYDKYEKTYPGEHRAKVGNAVGMLHRFRNAFKKGDRVLSYDPQSRSYMVGELAGDYRYDSGRIPGYPHLRPVTWRGDVERDALSVSARNSLGSPLTVFEVTTEIWEEFEAVLRGETSAVSSRKEVRDELVQVKEDKVEQAHEFIKDKLNSLDEEQMEELVASVLRAMGYKARRTPKGPDRGVDVKASPDGLDLEEPRIKAEVKYRQRTTMGSQDIRSFIGALREGDRGLYVSTGGFTKDAKYEADRANVPVTLVTLDDLADLVVMHYENFDSEGRALMPLTKIYWPAE